MNRLRDWQERFHAFLSRHFRPDYDLYIRSSKWRSISYQAKERAGWCCQGCNRRHGEVLLETHHRTYNRLGFELPQDLTVLCTDCHLAITEVIRLIRKGKLGVLNARRKPK